MKKIPLVTFLILIFTNSYSQRFTTNVYSLPDSVKAVSFVSDIIIRPTETKKEVSVGIGTDVVKLFFESHKNEREIEFEFPSGSTIVATGLNVIKEKNDLKWKYDWKYDENYKLMIATTGDSVGNFSLYSGYVFLPNENKWKLIGTCKISGQWNTLKQPASVYSKPKKTFLTINARETWIQRNNGSWKNINTIPINSTAPVINLLSHVDSLEQLAIEKRTLEKLQSPNSPIKYKESGGVYFAIMKEGTGRQVSINDTVVVFYKGYLFDDNSVFDETKDKPATFPLKRLITGWQIALPYCKIGGKVQVIIPSNLAYSIRTRAAKIPPNSILVFEIEVVDAKAPQ